MLYMHSAALHKTLALKVVASRGLKNQVKLCLAAAKVLELYPFLEETGVIDEILPKKEQAALAKL